MRVSEGIRTAGPRALQVTAGREPPVALVAALSRKVRGRLIDELIAKRRAGPWPPHLQSGNVASLVTAN